MPGRATGSSVQLTPTYSTPLGRMYQCSVEEFLDSRNAKRLRGKIQLIFTSPPFPLNRKKSYGNLDGDDYLKWLADLAPRFRELLTDDGSLVIEMGNAWVAGKPVQSTLALRTLLEFLERGELNLCQQFVCHNPARLPSPAQWVNLERIRVKDSYTNVWWMSPSERPKASNRNVLVEYSEAMKDLLRSGRYNAGARPSGHVIGETSFLRDNGGAIPSNVLTFSNTAANDEYREYCRFQGLMMHPAPMQKQLAEFFVKLLTDRGDWVFDPFAGSNVTGQAAELHKRRWIGTELDREYVAGSIGRFDRVAAT